MKKTKVPQRKPNKAMSGKELLDKVAETQKPKQTPLQEAMTNTKKHA